METEFENAVGKNAGEVLRDVEEFLAQSCVLNPEKGIDAAALTEEFNMAEQFSFALLSEAQLQGWKPEEAENFYRRACLASLGDATVRRMTDAFRAPGSEEFASLEKRYGNRFSIADTAYWPLCLALAADSGNIAPVMRYLRLFTVCLMEFAYMGDRNPDKTYTWGYAESFRRMLDALTTGTTPAPEAKPLKVRAVGGSIGKQDGTSYYLTVGVDIENPNKTLMARDVNVDVTVKDRGGKVVTVIRDHLRCMDPGVIYHYGITKRVKGEVPGHLGAEAAAASFLPCDAPMMKRLALSSLRLSKSGEEWKISGSLSGSYEKRIDTLTLHYQFLSAENKILGGGSEWIFDGLEPGTSHEVVSRLNVPIRNAAKAVWSVDFDAGELLGKGENP